MDHGARSRRMPPMASIRKSADVIVCMLQQLIMLKRLRWAALLAMMLWCGTVVSTPATAQASYPSRPIRIVTPLAAGAASDIALRILAEKLAARFRVPVLVQNQPGAAGVIAERAVTNAPADGYTILWAGNNTAIGVSLFKEPVDPRKELRPIVGVSEFAYLFVTSENSPFSTLRQWMTAVKEKPGTLTIGTSGPGTTNYLAALLMRSI
jgi:tripartite-type tricarboxylate transporter receptor subunit TctC